MQFKRLTSFQVRVIVGLSMSFVLLSCGSEPAGNEPAAKPKAGPIPAWPAKPSENLKVVPDLGVPASDLINTILADSAEGAAGDVTRFFSLQFEQLTWLRAGAAVVESASSEA